MIVYAHTTNTSLFTWETLDKHALRVAMTAGTFAEAFNSKSQAFLMGLLHDLGKARSSFQSYLKRSNEIEDDDSDYGEHSHSGAGACFCYDNSFIGPLGRALAYCIIGHHAGLPDWLSGETPNGALAVRLEQEKHTLQEKTVQEWLSSHQEDLPQTKLKPPFIFSQDDSSLSFWIRMMFSCLVDADYLQTEMFMNPEQGGLRHNIANINELSESFFDYLEEKQRSAMDTAVNHIRAEIRKACEEAALQPPGLFSLTVPTGGGKTLSSTAFAFRHALANVFKRIIYVIPYTSIIEQTAETLREALGKENVLEHHSNFDPEKETIQSRLASENWDATVIVTTAVQFFESLYACKTGQCRKLHNVAESVVILDEVQLLPARLLLPCTEAIHQLVQHYRTTVLLSTATQLDLPGIDKTTVREIIPSTLNLYQRLKRTDVEFPKDLSSRYSWDELAVELSSFKQVLCIVNTRRDCHELFSRMPEGTIHLSALMCGEHRSKVIKIIKNRLKAKQPIRVISTQIVEAGVDIDFPVVYRAFTGLASIAQAGGRCNREGKLAKGRVVVFMPPNPSPRGELLQEENAMRELLGRQRKVDVDNQDSFPEYFHLLHLRVQDLGGSFRPLLGIPIPNEYNAGNINKADVFKYQFREAAVEFKMVDDGYTIPVIVRYGDNADLIENLMILGPKRDIMRRLQRYSVNVPQNDLNLLMEKGFVEEIKIKSNANIKSGIFVQTLTSVYNDEFGLDLFRDGFTPKETIL